MSILQSSSGIVDVQQQRLNCALPSHLSELWFLSIPKSSRHAQLFPILSQPGKPENKLCSPNLLELLST